MALSTSTSSSFFATIQESTKIVLRSPFVINVFMNISWKLSQINFPKLIRKYKKSSSLNIGVCLTEVGKDREGFSVYAEILNG